MKKAKDLLKNRQNSPKYAKIHRNSMKIRRNSPKIDEKKKSRKPIELEKKKVALR
jgi:hypothetical protein